MRDMHPRTLLARAASLKPPILKGFVPGLTTLVRAYVCADDADVNPWNNAVTLDELRSQGFVISDLDWLVASGHLLYGRDASNVAINGNGNRTADWKDGESSISFVLTDRGYDFANEIINRVLRSMSGYAAVQDALLPNASALN